MGYRTGLDSELCASGVDESVAEFLRSFESPEASHRDGPLSSHSSELVDANVMMSHHDDLRLRDPWDF